MLKWAIKIGLTVFGVQLAFFAWVKIFSVDELTYLHGAWLITKGFVPFRDFDLPHHFLICYLQSGLFFLFPDGVLPILLSRMLMWTLFVLVALLAFYINGKDGFAWTGLVFMFMASSPLFTKHIIDVRPDSLSFLFFLVALFIVLKKHFSPPIRAGIVGLLLCLSVLSCVKVLVYGFPLFLFLIGDLLRDRLRTQGVFQFKRVAFFLCSIGSVLLLCVIWIHMTGSWSGWIDHIQQSMKFLFYHRTIPWERGFVATIQENLWIFSLAMIGFVRNIIMILRLGWRSEKNAVLLNMTWLFAMFSYTVQSRPFPYSFLPFWGVAALLAASGTHWLLCKKNMRIRVAGFVFLFIGFASSFARHQKFFDARLNHYQKQVWNLIAILTNEDDTIFDNVGGFVFRHDTARHFSRSVYHLFTNRAALSNSIIPQMENSKCIAWMADNRANSLPKNVQSYLYQNFVPYNGDLAFWGKRYYLENGTNDLVFKAVKSDRYFLSPETALDHGQVWINGQELKEPIFYLEEGIHQIRISSLEKEFVISWLPRNGKRFVPLKTLNPEFYKS